MIRFSMSRSSFMFIMSGLLASVAACTTPVVTPTPIAAGPSPTATVSLPASIPVSATKAVVASLTSTATATATETATQTPSPTLTPSPTSTSTPTAVVSKQLAEADALLLNGDYQGATEAYQEIVASFSDDPLAEEATFGLGKALWLEDDATAAAQVFLSLGNSDSYRETHPEILYWLGQALKRVGQVKEAAAAFIEYAEQQSLLDSRAYSLAGDAYAAVQDTSNAIASYEQALSKAPDIASKLRAREGIAAASIQAGDFERAIAQYQAILISASQPGYRAEMHYQLGQTQLANGQTEDAYASFQEAMRAGPTSHFAYLALADLVNAEQPVDSYLRGRIDVAAGAYQPAIDILHEYMDTNPNHAAEAHALVARAYEGQKDYIRAEIEWQQLTDTHANDTAAGAAWLGRGRSYWRRDDPATAREVYLRAAELSLDRTAAAEALWWAAIIAERDEGTLSEATADFARLAQEYPESKYATRAAFRSGLTSFQLGDFEAARTIWSAAADAGDGLWEAAASYWLGRSLEVEGNTDEAITHWQEMTERWSAGNYYGLRARQTLAERQNQTMEPGVPGDSDSDSLPALTTWLESWVESDVPIDLTESRSGLERAAELHRVGETVAAAAAFEALRLSWHDDPVALLQLALMTRDLGYYNTSIRTAARFQVLSPDRLANSPVYLQKLIFPIYYADLILPAATKYDIEPHVLLGLIRQESLFGSAATSGAAARGLAQIIPSTGQSIAQQLGWPDYRDELLYRPYINVDFGAFYLSQGLNRTGGNVPQALAGYNGGPGNAAFWRDLAGDDDDLFLELINFDETHLYLRTVAVQSNHYRRLYPELANE